MGKLDGKVAIITGAAQGMGESHVRRFIEEGAKGLLTDAIEQRSKEIAAELGENALFIPHDVASLADWKSDVAEAEKAFGTVNVLVNNAGILGPITGTVEFDEEEYLKVIAINQHSQYFGMKTVIPLTQKTGDGAIVNISLSAGMVSIVGAPNIAYVGSKFDSRGMTKHAAQQYGPDNIRVNAVHPGYIKTPMMAAVTDEDGGEIADQVPLHRIVDPSEVSGLVLLLACDVSSYMSGMEHVIDGGLTSAQDGQELAPNRVGQFLDCNADLSSTFTHL